MALSHEECWTEFGSCAGCEETRSVKVRLDDSGQLVSLNDRFQDIEVNWSEEQELRRQKAAREHISKLGFTLPQLEFQDSKNRTAKVDLDESPALTLFVKVVAVSLLLALLTLIGAIFVILWEIYGLYSTI